MRVTNVIPSTDADIGKGIDLLLETLMLCYSSTILV